MSLVDGLLAAGLMLLSNSGQSKEAVNSTLHVVVKAVPSLVETIPSVAQVDGHEKGEDKAGASGAA